MGRIWVGIDAGKDFHWAVGLAEDGQVVLSRRVENRRRDVIQLVGEARRQASEVTWAIDIPEG